MGCREKCHSMSVLPGSVGKQQWFCLHNSVLVFTVIAWERSVCVCDRERERERERKGEGEGEEEEGMQYTEKRNTLRLNRIHF